MAILIDADVLIEAERRTFNFDGWVASQRGTDFKLAAITVSELQHGIERGVGLHRLRRERFFQAIFPVFEILPFTFNTAFVHARLWATLESTGQMIGPHDLILAATAIQTGNAVATFNKRHFSAVQGLEVIEPA
ncbi:MAG TPA: PIN domain-containing protein [Terracidiphilus sp.]|jgi:tRNA(fMet)-specific endonuclease VapC